MRATSALLSVAICTFATADLIQITDTNYRYVDGYGETEDGTRFIYRARQELATIEIDTETAEGRVTEYQLNFRSNLFDDAWIVLGESNWEPIVDNSFNFDIVLVSADPFIASAYEYTLTDVPAQSTIHITEYGFTTHPAFGTITGPHGDAEIPVTAPEPDALVLLCVAGMLQLQSVRNAIK